MEALTHAPRELAHGSGGLDVHWPPALTVKRGRIGICLFRETNIFLLYMNIKQQLRYILIAINTIGIVQIMYPKLERIQSEVAYQ